MANAERNNSSSPAFRAGLLTLVSLLLGAPVSGWSQQQGGVVLHGDSSRCTSDGPSPAAGCPTAPSSVFRLSKPAASDDSKPEPLNTAPAHRRTTARTMINQANTKRAIEAHNSAAQGGTATIVIGGGGTNPPPSPPLPEARRLQAAQLRVDAATLKAIEDEKDDVEVLVIAPQAFGNVTYRYAQTIRPGVLNDAMQKRLLEAALKRAEDGESFLFVPQIQTSLDGSGRRLADRRGADRARLREAAIKALRNNRAEQVIILLDLPQ